MVTIEGLIQQVKKYLIQKYNCHTIILYGSYISGDYTEESDIDILCFWDHTEEKNDVEMFQGKQLDVWVYNSDKMNQPGEFLRVHGGRILLNEKGVAEKFLSKVEVVYNDGPDKLTQEEKDFLKAWLQKMYLRSEKGDLEGNYRFHWMLKDCLELYFEMKGLWFLGPKKAFKWLQVNDPSAYNLFRNALDRGANHEEAKKLIQYMQEI